MNKSNKRKMRPEPPKYYWLDTDGCWDCKNRNNCNGCRRLKKYVFGKAKGSKYYVQGKM